MEHLAREELTDSRDTMNSFLNNQAHSGNLLQLDRAVSEPFVLRSWLMRAFVLHRGACVESIIFGS